MKPDNTPRRGPPTISDDAIHAYRAEQKALVDAGADQHLGYAKSNIELCDVALGDCHQSLGMRRYLIAGEWSAPEGRGYVGAGGRIWGISNARFAIADKVAGRPVGFLCTPRSIRHP